MDEPQIRERPLNRAGAIDPLLYVREEEKFVSCGCGVMLSLARLPPKSDRDPNYKTILTHLVYLVETNTGIQE